MRCLLVVIVTRGLSDFKIKNPPDLKTLEGVLFIRLDIYPTDIFADSFQR